MIKVLVYGELESVERIAAFLEKEIPIEVNKLVVKKKFLEMSMAEVMRKTENDLYNLIGKNDLIILTDPMDVMVTGEELRRRYPEQKFVYYGQGLERVVRKLKMIYILTSQKIRRSEAYQRMKARCQDMEIIEPDSVGWIEMMKKKWVDKEEIAEKVKSVQGAPIIVFHPELSLAKMKALIDWRGEVVDIEKVLLTSVKAELGFKC